MKATNNRFSNKVYNYTLVAVSKEEMKRRGLVAHKLTNCPFLIALDYTKNPYKKSDNTTWGHIYKGGFLFGVCSKVYKSQDAYIIVEQPVQVEIAIEKKYDFYGSFRGYARKGENKTYRTIQAIARANKAIYGSIIGTKTI